MYVIMLTQSAFVSWGVLGEYPRTPEGKAVADAACSMLRANGYVCEVRTI